MAELSCSGSLGIKLYVCLGRTRRPVYEESVKGYSITCGEVILDLLTEEVMCCVFLVSSSLCLAVLQ